MVQLNRHSRDDRGVTLVELLVSMILMAAVALIASTAIMWVQRTTTSQIRNGELWADMQDASTQLLRDVTDGQRILVADPNTLTIEVVRDSKCQVREWVADTTAKRLSVNTTFYEQAQCIGTPSGTRTDRLVGDNAVGTNASGTNPKQYISPATFAYFETLSTTPLASPVETDRVTRVEWDLQAKVDDGYRTEPLKSGAAFTPRASQQAGGGDQANPKSALLCNVLRLLASGTTTCDTTPLVSVTPGAVEGKDPPVLQWVDRSAPGVTTGWTVLRVANPEGMADTAAGRTTWSYLTSLPAATTSFKDSTLPDGYTAQYLVASNVTTGLGPVSNKIVSGLRPAAPTTLTATGHPTTIDLAWTASIGATGYDVYRDGILAASITDGATLTWTDALGFGHAHGYQVVAVNRWENRLTTTTDTGRLDLGALLSAGYTGGTRITSPTASAFTAPATPSLTATAGDRVSALSWAPTAWVGSGPQPVATWRVQYRSSTEAATQVATTTGATVTWTHGARPAGRWSEYAIIATDASGDAPSTSWPRVWQRPATPTCTVSVPSTRTLTTSADGLAATADESYSNYEVRMDGAGWSPNSSSFDPLTDGTTYNFRVHVSGAGGWSDEGACAGTTAVLATPGVPTCAANLVDSIAPGTISVAGGTEVKLGSSGTVYASPRSFSGLGAGTYYGYARSVATDGYNTHTSGWDTCPGRTVVGPPATPSSSSFDFTQQRYCSPAVGFSVSASWSPVAGATSYDVQMRYNTTDNGFMPWDTHTVGGTNTSWDVYDEKMVFGTAQVQVRANNGAGSSAWSTTVTASVTGGCQAG